jgi:hypothetical protein
VIRQRPIPSLSLTFHHSPLMQAFDTAYFEIRSVVRQTTQNKSIILHTFQIFTFFSYLHGTIIVCKFTGIQSQMGKVTSTLLNKTGIM